ncbi:MAG: hypothetical protein M1837_000395 [Sclerophora amabilis]|nr:MAG: hypothetical protein M1837_000395 [Sclerophora amabilis]
MISDNDLYTLAIFLGSLSMLLIVLYHFLEVNAKHEPAPEEKVAGATTPVSQGGGKTGSKR